MSEKQHKIDEYELIGKKFHKLKIKAAYRQKAKYTRGTEVICDVVCDCGLEKTMRYFYINHGQAKSCGCGKYERFYK